ncbi:hypothetical protein TVAG_272210 [Trichomonas vaginalis G3]|uniref:Right handed beta helix domain-containing protein n=1 Tax=Trichomonas vaginalis (strain ATCC PRA-98 / G3) TaxID=412133 RepID=A2FXS8_TRIV3|nr:pectin lyase-like family [Trichomonas vaginalis G3]EAX90289.1 hypothetical protein TVAG_272210 [Trichomonas vaginalis G3]KAI5543546.1 pectin lyase-like family [Trichomonas vaginalis G3]|eukprot:XP_001303219.1 hypothetical protein [Trichomonas vaginalis G3]
MLNFLIFQRLYVKRTGSSTDRCLHNKPCDYQYILKNAKSGDFITILDPAVHKPKEHILFHQLIANCSKIGVNVDGNGVTIDGIQTNYSSTAYIDLQNIQNMSLSNIHFIEFTNPIFSFTNSKISLENISISGSNIHKNAIPINAKNSEINFTQLSLDKCTSHEKMFFKFTNSIINFEKLNMMYQFVFHEFKMPIVLSRNSKITFDLSNFENNNSPSAPFIRLEDKSIVNITNSNFKTNSHSDLIHSYHDNKATIINTVIDDYQGSLYSSTSNDQFSISSCLIRNSASTKYPMIYTIRSQGIIEYTKFENCAGQSIIGSFSKSKVTINNSIFDSNKPLQSVVTADINSEAIVENSSFDNTKAFRSILSSLHNSKISIGNSMITNSWTKAVDINMSKGYISNTTFEFNSGYSQKIASNHFGSLYIYDSNFQGKILNGMIDSFGKTILENNNFSSTHQDALPSNLYFFCKGCKFQESIINTNVDKRSILVTLVACIVAGAIISTRKGNIHYIIGSLFEQNKDYD